MMRSLIDGEFINKQNPKIINNLFLNQFQTHRFQRKITCCIVSRTQPCSQTCTRCASVLARAAGMHDCGTFLQETSCAGKVSTLHHLVLYFRQAAVIALILSSSSTFLVCRCPLIPTVQNGRFFPKCYRFL